MNSSLVRSLGGILGHDASNRLKSVRVWAASALISPVVTVLVVSNSALELSLVVGISLTLLVMLFVTSLECMLAAIWLCECFRKGAAVVHHATNAALLVKRVRPDGSTILTVGSVGGQIGRFARFELIRAEREGAQGALSVRVSRGRNEMSSCIACPARGLSPETK